jgi:SAM-dependent methyltransferase
MRMLARVFEKQKKKCWRFIEQVYPETKDKYARLRDLVAEAVVEFSDRKQVVILDAGCGHKTINDYPFRSKITYIGIDISKDSIDKNCNIDKGIVCDLMNIPLEDESVDIIVSAMVFEHLKSPDKVFQELSRLIRPDGYLIFMTPCVYNIVVIINRMFPHFISQKLGKALTGQEESDIFPTFYKVNSPKRIDAILTRNGFIKSNIIMYQPPPYAFVFSKTVLKIINRFYQIINKYDQLQFLRGIIIGKYRKRKQRAGLEPL